MRYNNFFCKAINNYKAYKMSCNTLVSSFHDLYDDDAITPLGSPGGAAWLPIGGLRQSRVVPLFKKSTSSIFQVACTVLSTTEKLDLNAGEILQSLLNSVDKL